MWLYCVIILCDYIMWLCDYIVCYLVVAVELYPEAVESLGVGLSLCCVVCCVLCVVAILARYKACAIISFYGAS